jgi:hypothetical protein
VRYFDFYFTPQVIFTPQVGMILYGCSFYTVTEQFMMKSWTQQQFGGMAKNGLNLMMNNLVQIMMGKWMPLRL